MPSLIRSNLVKIYKRLFQSFGPQHWWPGDTPFEIIVGAILTQNTNWGNVEKAIRNLKNENLLSPRAFHRAPRERLASVIRSAGYFNVKAKRLKNFVDFLFNRYWGDLRKMRKTPIEILRKELLAVNGIGPETADSILLYAFDKPVFVIDAYTKRIFYRHNFIDRAADYHQAQDLMANNLRKDTRLFNEYHALIVRLGKDFCRPNPRCEGCPLKNIRYSLVNRCRRCYRAFTAGEKYRSKGRLCRHCQEGIRTN